MNKTLLAAGILMVALGAGGLFMFWPEEPEPEPEVEDVEQPMTEKEQIELMMRIGYIQQEDLDELPDEEPEPE